MKKMRFGSTLVFACVLAYAGGQSFASTDDALEQGLEAYEAGDFATALEVWRPLAEAGGNEAQYHLGVMNDSGHGTVQNYGAALEWYRKAANSGSSNAMFAVGNLYANGFGVGKDRAEARRWYCRAAKLGHKQATEMLNQDPSEICSEKGQGSPR